MLAGSGGAPYLRCEQEADRRARPSRQQSVCHQKRKAWGGGGRFRKKVAGAGQGGGGFAARRCSGGTNEIVKRERETAKGAVRPRASAKPRMKGRLAARATRGWRRICTTGCNGGDGEGAQGGAGAAAAVQCGVCARGACTGECYPAPACARAARLI